MNRKSRLFSGVVFFLLTSTPMVIAQDKTDVTDGDLKTDHGQINWSDRTITATGSGAPDLQDPRAKQNVAVARLGAERVAKLDALRNILEALKGVQISSESTVEKEMVTNDKMRTKLEGVARNFKVIRTKYYSDGGVDVVVQMSLDGPLGSSLVPPGSKGGALPSNGSAKHTGLVIDARGFKVIPALAPRLLDEAGKSLYDSEFIEQAVLEANGVLGYFRDLESAKTTKRVGSNPLVLKALKLKEGSMTDIVLSNADADKLRDREANVRYLADAKVVIVLD